LNAPFVYCREADVRMKTGGSEVTLITRSGGTESLVVTLIASLQTY